jgi:adenine-specific DNA-methyltransferase
MDKLKMHSPDLSQQNIEKIRALFPNCVTEAKTADDSIKLAIDFDQLKQELSDSIVEGPQERYHLNWPGKREAILAANTPIAKTLRPCREESVNFDTTKNLFIEGDNLEALKLLQETYLGKVKLIYIDPPYNTGNDFIYDDDFSLSSEEYLKKSNQSDSVGNKLIINSESRGRFHSDWLTMMYPRLKLARNLLSENGVIFISIDDGEVENLKKICSEIFGSENFISNVIWEKKFAPQNDEKYITASHDHILVYTKSIGNWFPNLLPRTEEALKKFKNPDNDPRGVWTSGDLTSKTKAKDHSYPITSPSGKVFLPPNGRQWAPSLETFQRMLKENRIWFGENGDNMPRAKQFLSEIQSGVVPMSIWNHSDVGHNQSATQELKKLFDGFNVFDSPKPVSLIKRILFLATANDDIVLDFFAGSGTTGHAVMKLNAEDGGNRRFILIQLPENCSEKSEAYKAGYRKISEISQDRLRKAGKLILSDEPHSAWKKDAGFRVLRIDSSNMNNVFYKANEITQETLDLFVENIKTDRKDEDLLFQVLLDWGVDLSLSVTKIVKEHKEIYTIDGNILIACFDKKITDSLVRYIAEQKPLRAVFRSDGFSSDTNKINAEQLFRQLSPHTEIKTI